MFIFIIFLMRKSFRPAPWSWSLKWKFWVQDLNPQEESMQKNIRPCLLTTSSFFISTIGIRIQSLQDFSFPLPITGDSVPETWNNILLSFEFLICKGRHLTPIFLCEVQQSAQHVQIFYAHSLRKKKEDMWVKRCFFFFKLSCFNIWKESNILCWKYRTFFRSKP